MNGGDSEIRIMDSEGRVLRVISVAEATAERDRLDQKRRKQRPTRRAIAAAVAKARTGARGPK
jgi:hypothetical protein